MVTGDQTAIAKETCRELGMGTNILNTETLNDKSLSQMNLDEIILNAHGFAEVMPEVRGVGAPPGGRARPAWCCPPPPDRFASAPRAPTCSTSS